MSRLLLPGLAVFALLTVSVAAQDLKELAAKQKVAAEKLTTEVNKALDRSRQLEKIDPDRARILLTITMAEVKDSKDLAQSDQDKLLRNLQARLKQIGETDRGRKIASEQQPQPPTKKSSGGNPGTGVGDVSKKFIDSAGGAQKNNADLIRDREKGVLGTIMNAENSHKLSGKEFELPANWKELSKRRLEMVSPKLTQKEAMLLKALNSTMTPDYDGQEFKAVISHLQDKSGITILVDEQSLQEAMVDYKDPVNFRGPKMTVRTILKKVLGDKNLTYIIKEGAVQVMTPKKASEYLVTRTYQVDDLVQPSQSAMFFGPLVAQAQMLSNAQTLINLISATVEPNYWQPNGPGSIVFYPPTRSIIIRASSEMHYQLSSPGMFGGR
jgi:hypothetical protein